MQTFSIVVAFLGFVSFSLQTNLLNLTAPIEGYSVEDFVFAIDIPGGPSVNLTGSIQQVIHELNATYGYEVPAPTISPYDSFSNSSLTNMNAARASRASKLDRPSKTIGARATRTPTHGSVICDGPWGQTEAVNIISGIHYLNTVPGKPANGPGPGNCGRVSCEYHSAIWWCNDNDYTKTLNSFSEIGDGAYQIGLECQVLDFLLGWFVAGQDFYQDGWNVIVRDDWHNC